MQIIGVDLHSRQQTVAMLNVETGEIVFLKKASFEPWVYRPNLKRTWAHLESKSATAFENSSERITGPFKKTARGSWPFHSASRG
jgi:hypothetical protein